MRLSGFLLNGDYISKVAMRGATLRQC
jgi:hypothetical protein